MKTIIARCGFWCDSCGAFVKNNKSKADRLEVAVGWSKYFHLTMKPDSLRCNGCLADECGDHDLPEKNCVIRRCVIKRKLENCGECSDYPCKELEERMAGVEKVIKRFENEIPKKEFQRFIAPYDARTTFDRLRTGKSLSSRNL
jgi:hypothetical protein